MTDAIDSDNLIEQLADECVTLVLDRFSDLGDPWDTNTNIDAALTLAAQRLLANTTALSEQPHISIEEIIADHPSIESRNL